MAKEDFFSGVNDATPMGARDPRPKPGFYPEVEIESVRYVDGYKGEFVIVSMRPTVPGEGEDTSPVGVTMAQLIKKDRYDYYKNDLAGLAEALAPGADRDDTLRKAFSSETAFKGRKFQLKAYIKDGSDFTNVIFYPLTSQTAQPPAPPPAAVAETPETAPGGPWFELPAGRTDGTHYNAAGEVRTF